VEGMEVSSESAANNAGDQSLCKDAMIDGIIYLLLAAFSAFSMIYVSPRLFVPGDAADATKRGPRSTGSEF